MINIQKLSGPVDPVNPVKTFDFFLAGVIQGSISGLEVHQQDYREEIKEILARRAPGRSLFCPVENHRHSVFYADEEAREVFFGHLEILRQSRVMIAYLPTASMGTAVEMEICRQAEIPVVSITPLKHNWVIRLYSQAVLPDLAAFAEWLTPEHLAALGL